MKIGYFNMPLHPPGSDFQQTLHDDLEQIEIFSLLEAMMQYLKRIEKGKPQPLMTHTICGFSKLPTKFIPTQ